MLVTTAMAGVKKVGPEGVSWGECLMHTASEAGLVVKSFRLHCPQLHMTISYTLLSKYIFFGGAQSVKWLP